MNNIILCGQEARISKGLSQVERGHFETVRHEDEPLREARRERRNQEVFEVSKGMER